MKEAPVITYKLSKEEIEEIFKDIKPMTAEEITRERVYTFDNYKQNKRKKVQYDS